MEKEVETGKEIVNKDAGIGKEIVKRPLLVTIICIFGFIGVPLQILGSLLLLIPQIVEFADMANKVLPSWYYMLHILFAILFLISLIFIWKMKKWGLIFYTILIAIDYGIYWIAFSISRLNIFMLIINIVILGLLWTQFKKMS